MTLAEFCSRYNFHDSVLTKLECSADEWKMHCAFCNFMQADYRPNEDANSDILCVFHGAQCRITEGFRISDAGFLHQEMQNGELVFLLENGPNETGELRIRADSAEVFTLRTYTL